MREAYITINNVPTKVMTWGKWIEEDFKPNEKDIIILIPGNPGLLGFYTNFLGILYETIGGKIPIWAIGHAGHAVLPTSTVRKIPELSSNEDKFDLSGQLAHKVAFIKKYVPSSDVKIHFVGHSIGCWMIIELLKNLDIQNKVRKSYLLFPTIERMGTSPNAAKIKIIIRFLFIFKFILKILSKFPVFLQTILLYIYFYFASMPIEYLGTGLNFANPNVFEKCMFLANDEFRSVTNLDVETLNKNKKKIKLYYGTTDGWVPVSYFNELKIKIPDIDAELDAKLIPHAFIIDAKKDCEMAVQLAKWINESF